jgi:hypothetical protein
MRRQQLKEQDDTRVDEGQPATPANSPTGSTASSNEATLLRCSLCDYWTESKTNARVNLGHHARTHHPGREADVLPPDRRLKRYK